MSEDPKVRVSFYIRQSCVDKLQEYAAEENRSQNNALEQIIDTCIPDNDRDHESV